MINELDINIEDIDAIVERIGSGNRNVIPILSAIQKEFHYLPQEALQRVCEITDITAANIASVASFYSSFRHSPAGKHMIKVCIGTACHVKGATRIKDAILRYLNIEEESDTDSEGLFTVLEVACLGCCTLAPAVQIDDVTYGHLTPTNIGEMIDDFLKLQLDLENSTSKKDDKSLKVEKNGKDAIRISLGACCVAGGSGVVMEALEDEIRSTQLEVNLKEVACTGVCHQTPIVEVFDKDGISTLYSKVTPDQAQGIVRAHFKPKKLFHRLAGEIDSMLEIMLSGGSKNVLSSENIDVRDSQIEAFLGKQKNIATANCGHIDPLDIDEYIVYDGFKALKKVLKDETRDKIVDEIIKSGLRGRGGAGFPTGKKWALVKEAKGDKKYVVMNGDEGDPGAYMDRKLLESFPFRVLEGVMIAAYSVGADSGELYIRDEYPLAVSRIRKAITIMEENGYLGKNILNSGFDFEINVMEGAGAFICGEESALLESIEGKRGIPRMRPPYPVTNGLWGKPTLVNNVETFACISWIIANGAEKFASIGSEKSKGTKVFSLTGKIKRGGLIEVPMGMTINEIVNDIGGGVEEGRVFKAVQIGGPSGGCIPADLCDIPVDYEKLGTVGAIMGSGGLVVLDDTDCMLDVAKYFLEFSQEQSCGKCTFCRIGTTRMVEILHRICDGRGRKGDIEKLEHLGNITKKGSLCGLGQTAPNSVLTTIKYFREEYEAHINGSCPALKCSKLIKYFITTDCIGCTKCAQVCPVDAIEMIPHERHKIDDEKCIRCDMCRNSCSVSAVKIRS